MHTPWVLNARRYDAALHTKHVLHMIHTHQVTTRIIHGKGVVLVLVELACPPHLRFEVKIFEFATVPCVQLPHGNDGLIFTPVNYPYGPVLDWSLHS